MRSKLFKRITSFIRHFGCVGFAVLLLGAKSFAQWTEPELLPPPINVTPGGNYYYAAISADGQILCITINSPSGFGDDDVYISERIGDSSWTVPVNAGPNVNNEARNLSPSITSDRQRLYYVRWTGQSYDVYVSHRTGPDWDDWSEGVALPEPVNVRQEFTCQISFDDSTLVFTSDGRPGPLFGQEVICTSRLQPDESWSEPVIIAPHLNQINGSLHPCLTDSGATLVYGMFGGPSLHFDIFYAVHNDTGFGNAIRCDSTINTAYWDSSPSCPVDGSYVIFDSRRNRPQGSGPAQLFIARRVGTSVSPWLAIPQHFPLSAYPNPFNSTINITLEAPLHSETTLTLYDLLGREVDVIHRGRLTSTTLSYTAPATLSSGIYFLLAANTTQSAMQKVVLLK